MVERFSLARGAGPSFPYNYKRVLAPGVFSPPSTRHTKLVPPVLYINQKVGLLSTLLFRLSFAPVILDSLLNPPHQLPYQKRDSHSFHSVVGELGSTFRGPYIFPSSHQTGKLFSLSLASTQSLPPDAAFCVMVWFHLAQFSMGRGLICGRPCSPLLPPYLKKKPKFPTAPPFPVGSLPPLSVSFVKFPT